MRSGRCTNNAAEEYVESFCILSELNDDRCPLGFMRALFLEIIIIIIVA